MEFSKLYEKETAKRELRQAIEMVVADAVQHVDADLIAGWLVHRADFIGLTKPRNPATALNSATLESLKRLRDGKLRTNDDLLREIADRNLNAHTRPDR